MVLRRFASAGSVVCAALLLLFAASVAADDAKSTTAILLAARASLPDPNFSDSVVLVMNNIGPLPGGVIVNRPTGIPVSRLFPDIAPLAPLNDKVYFGGPVQIATISFLFRADAPPENAVQVLDGVYMSMNLPLLRRLLAREKPMQGLRIYIGYSGWAPGQLEAEIARGDWTLSAAHAEAIFEGRNERPWPGAPAAGGDERI